MNVTPHVTRDSHRTFGRTFGVSHGPITRPDPNRPDPAHMQLLGGLAFHHVVQLGNRPATVVTTSPVTTPDGMMRRTAVNRT